MNTTITWRRALAIPAALMLALGGSLLTATAANAADGMLVVDNPASGATVDSRTVTVDGSAAPGAVINVFTDSTREVRLAQTTTDGTTGAFSVTLPTYPDTAPVAQSIFIDGLVGLSGFDEPITRDFVLPEAAPVETFEVETPAANSQLTSRTVVFSGTGTDGSTVDVLDPANDDARLAGPAVVQDGRWSLEYTYDELADRQQTVRITQITDGSGTGDVDVTFNLPTGQTFVVETPAEGSTTESRTVEFSGTGNEGSTVNVLDPETGERVGPQAVVGDDGRWTTTVVFTDDDAVAQSVRVTQVTGASGSGDLIRSFLLPVVVEPVEPIDTPVITSPAAGAALTGDRVTFEGTGTPGADIGLLVVPTAALEDDGGIVTQAAEVADPTDRIVVGDDGIWTVTLALAPGDYTAVAVSALLDESGQPVLDADGLPILAGPSEPVQFTLAAAAVAPPAAGGGTVPTAPAGSTLPQTGSEGAALALGLGAALALAGLAFTVLARRRTVLAAGE